MKDSVEETLKYMTAAAGPYANQEALKIYCENGPDTYQFCIDCGIKFGENLDLNHGVSGRAGIGLAYSGNELQAPYRDIAVPCTARTLYRRCLRQGHLRTDEENG